MSGTAPAFQNTPLAGLQVLLPAPIRLKRLLGRRYLSARLLDFGGAIFLGKALRLPCRRRGNFFAAKWVPYFPPAPRGNFFGRFLTRCGPPEVLLLEREGAGFLNHRAQLSNATAAMIIEKWQAHLPPGKRRQEQRQHGAVVNPMHGRKINRHANTARPPRSS